MSTAVFACLAALVALFLIYSRRPSSSKPYPPGPKPVPVLGNIRDLTSKELWLTAKKWANEFGSVCYLHICGQGLVFLNTPEAVFDLLDKRGSIYSDKPNLVMAGELCGCNDMVAFTPYGDRARRQRKLMHRAFGVQAVRRYEPLLEIETQSFLRRLVANTTDYESHIRRYAGGLTLLVVYGYQVRNNDDKFLTLAEECVSLLSNEITSGGGIWPVDLLPFLRHMPTWMPGSTFKVKAAEWKAKMIEFVEKPFESVKADILGGNAVPSFCSTLLGDDELKALDPQEEFDIKWTANSMYSASIDTTITIVMHFILAVLLHPDKCIKAQQEIDTVVGRTRLPTFSDRPSLPYVNALMSECFRWGVPVPLNLPHRLMEDDVYNGMFIPKGSLIFGNIWAILRDERIYPNPDTFLPERFLEEVDIETAKRRDPRNYVFGFGRRRCPGANLIESSAWILITSILATLDIRKARDEAGNVIEPEVVFANSVFRTPNVFKCDIRPRNEQALRIIQQTEVS